MALNIAVPIRGVDDLLNELQQLSPVSPLNLKDCQLEDRKISCSPNGSDSSGISSLDSEDIKKSSSTSSSPIEEPRPSVGTSIEADSLVILPKDTLIINDSNLPQTVPTSSQLVSPKPKHPISKSSESSDSAIYIGDETEDSNDEANVYTNEEKADEELSNESIEEKKEEADYYSIEEQRKMIAKLCIALNGRNILDLGANLGLGQPEQPEPFITHAELPANNIKMFLANRSLYHRLDANCHIQEYALAKCTCCDLIYPSDGYNSTDKFNNVNNVMTQNARPDEENNLAAGVLAYLKSATVNIIETPAHVISGGSMTMMGDYYNEYSVPSLGMTASKYNKYPQPTATMVNALLNTKEPNFINNNANNLMNNFSNNKHMYNTNNLNNMAALNRVLNGGNMQHNNTTATVFNSPVSAKNNIENLAAALLSQNLLNNASAHTLGNTNNPNNYHNLHNQHNSYNQHHKMAPPQNNYSYYKQF